MKSEAKKMKIRISILLIGLLVAGCSKNENLLYFAVGGAPNELDYWEDLIKKFEKETNIKVSLLRQPTDSDQRRQSLVISLKSKKSDPDVFLMDIAWISQFRDSNWLEPMEDYIKDSNLDTKFFFSSVIEQTEKLVSLPVYIDCGLLYYRKDLLEKYNLKVPETWYELLESSKIILENENKKHFYGFVWQGAQYEGLVCNFLEFITSNNGEIFNQKGQPVVNSEENAKALEFMKDIIQKYKISPMNTFTEMREEEVRSFFESGGALFERNWPYAYKIHEKESSPVKGKVGIAVLPKFKNGKHAATLGGWHIGMSEYSDNKVNAWKLIEYILSYEIQKDVVINLGWNPGRKDIYNDPEVIEKIPQMKVLKKAFEFSIARPDLPFYNQISEILQRNVNSCLSGKTDPEEALENAQKDIKRILKQYNVN